MNLVSLSNTNVVYSVYRSLFFFFFFVANFRGSSSIFLLIIDVTLMLKQAGLEISFKPRSPLIASPASIGLQPHVRVT